ncbi:MAG: site-specific integrase [Acidobacteriota bacterium]
MSTILRTRMIQDLRIRNYSWHTIDAYIRRVANFAKHFEKSPDLLGREHIREYQVFLMETKKASWGVFIQTVCALRFLYEVTLGRPEMIEYIPYPKPEKKLPIVLSVEQVHEFFNFLPTLKHRTIVKTMYAAGLRVSEVVRLLVQDIDNQRMVIRVQQGKGKKDRYVPLSPTLLKQLRKYWKAYQPQYWLFPGQSKNLPLSSGAVQRAVAQARRRSSIHKPVSCHTMRHCYATHNLEAGTDLRTIQIRLGHRSLHTTAMYLHVAAEASQLTHKPVDLLQRSEDNDTTR